MHMIHTYNIYIGDAASPVSPRLRRVPGSAWSGLCLIRGGRFHTAFAARQLLSTVGPSARHLLENRLRWFHSACSDQCRGTYDVTQSVGLTV